MIFQVLIYKGFNLDFGWFDTLWVSHCIVAVFLEVTDLVVIAQLIERGETKEKWR